MRTTHVVLAVALQLLTGMTATFARQTVDTAAARHVLVRTIGHQARQFHFVVLGDSGRDDIFEVRAAHGRVTIGGTSTIALTRGAYHYLRHACNTMVSWSGARLVLPARLPDFRPERVASPWHFRQYYNVCTFGYTTVWWDWKRWERELDWMALHGINMPLAMVGQEAIWQRVWNGLGISNDELSAYFTGPAFLPWHRMGNVNKHGGPLPQSWIDGQRKLQAMILTRMRELGMTPIVPAFSGFVPPALARTYPDAPITRMSNWANFPDDHRAALLSPRSALFVEIGQRFIEEYRKEFGPQRYYLADTFNEMEVPVSTDRRYDELATFGEAVFNSIRAGDPGGIWVMQGWMFYNDQRFWDTTSTKALLSRVPDERMLILDLANEYFHGWQKHRAFFGKQWIYSVIHNFGGNNPLNGNLPLFARDPFEALKSPAQGKLVGLGFAPEGIENNEVVYELLTDAGWQPSAINLDQWIEEYARSRYGSCPDQMKQAWRNLLVSIYDTTFANIKHGFQHRPSGKVQSDVPASAMFLQGLNQFLSCRQRMRSSPLYLQDAVELLAQRVGQVIDSTLAAALSAHGEKRDALRDTLISQAFELFRCMDRLVSSRIDRRVGTWIAAARRWGATREEADRYEQNARLQITTWGGPELFDYASKVWGGLIGGYYASRWKVYLEGLAAHRAPALIDQQVLAAEEAWIRTTEGIPAVRDVLPDTIMALALAGIEHAVRVPPAPDIRIVHPLLRGGDTAVVTLNGSGDGAPIFYTVDGSNPTSTSRFYEGPLKIAGACELRAAVIHPGITSGFVAHAFVESIDTARNGIHYAYYERSLTSLALFSPATFVPVREGRVFSFNLKELAPRPDGFVVRYTCRMAVPHSGTYSFFLTSDDGSSLTIDGARVVDNDGLHASTEKVGTVALDAGDHALEVRFFEAGGVESLQLEIEGPGVERRALPSSWLFTH